MVKSTGVSSLACWSAHRNSKCLRSDLDDSGLPTFRPTRERRWHMIIPFIVGGTGLILSTLFDQICVAVAVLD